MELKMRGYFGIGIYHGKHISNQGTLWRSAYQLGAAYIFTIGSRFRSEASDTMKSDRHIPCYEYSDFDQFLRCKPLHSVLIGVETGGKSITSFSHPSQGVYLLGAEDYGLPELVTKRCDQIISIPSVRSDVLNVAVAGSLIMFDRLSKSSICNVA